jgi:CDP-diacylglycerol--serine O-phosphatidyltransferase
MKRKIFRNAKPRLFNIGQILPSFVTLCSLGLSMTAILFAFQGLFGRAVVFIALAALCDGIDGRIARLFKSSSQFGVELDSLVDNVSFGVAPAFISLFWTTSQLKGIGWVLSVLFAVCMTLRLARFNAMTGKANIPERWKHFFMGVPAPAGGLLILWPIALYSITGEAIFASPGFNACVVGLTAFLLVSHVPTLSLKTLHIPKEFAPLLLAGLTLAFLLSIYYFYYVLSVIGAAYIASMPFTIARFAALKKEGL